MVGELPDPATVPGSKPAEGDRVVLVGPFAPSLAGSELAKLRGELADGLPATDVGAVALAIAFVRERIRAGGIMAAHDISDGGLAAALAEMTIAGGVGIEADLDGLVELRGCSGETALFGEGPGGILLALPADAAADLVAAAKEAGVDALELGVAGGDRIEISAAEREASVLLADAARAWSSLPERVESRQPG
jgi:phosphoribosylformylglycinamidine synthase